MWISCTNEVPNKIVHGNSKNESRKKKQKTAHIKRDNVERSKLSQKKSHRPD